MLKRFNSFMWYVALLTGISASAAPRGTCELTGRLVFPDGSPTDFQVNVAVYDLNGEYIANHLTPHPSSAPNGTFSFTVDNAKGPVVIAVICTGSETPDWLKTQIDVSGATTDLGDTVWYGCQKSKRNGLRTSATE